ncbi:MAG: NAD-dependent epimerase/dehydratase family protein [Bacteroidetes bacterium]|nr:MAG: NAD-dependent epimerase/dehydratase family protein [Bacteroidota bacterium]
MEKLNILVTGGAGYLGSILVPTLIDKGYNVTVLDNFMYDQTSLLECCAHDNFRVMKGDARNEKTVREALQGQDVIIPLAAIVGAPACDLDPVATRSTNYEAVALVNKLRSKEQRIIFPTTNSGYGIGQDGIYCTEETPLKPISLYGTTKVDAENNLLDSQNTITFRLATVFGFSPRMRLDLLVNDFTYRAFHDRYIVLFEAHFKRNYIHIRDVAKAFMFGIENFERMKNQPYNVGLSTANLSKMELCEKIKEQLPAFNIFVSEIGKDPDQRNYIVSNDKIEKLGYIPDHSIDMGIRELIKGFRIITNNKFANI